MNYGGKNSKNAVRLLRRIDPSYRFSWEVYDGILAELLTENTVWLDGGCGKNLAIEEQTVPYFKIGVDIEVRTDAVHGNPNHYAVACLGLLPFKEETFDLITLANVAEHFEDPDTVIREICRVLKPDGKILLGTTNLRSPIIFMGNLLGKRLRLFIMRKFMSAKENDIFTAYHALNTAKDLERLEGFTLERINFIQDINRSNHLVFLLFSLYHFLTKNRLTRSFQTNIIAVLKKDRF